MIVNERKDHFEANTDIGQNFLRDASVAEWMARRAERIGASRALEIGPGRGALTRALLTMPIERLDAIELDTRLAPYLDEIASADPRFSLRWGDAVSFDYLSIDPAPEAVIANLPYHITTPVIWRLLEQLSGRGMRYLLLMLQKEAAVRICSGAASRESSPLGVTIAALGRASIARNVPRGAFSPMPRVDSAIVEIALTGEMADLPRDEGWRRFVRASFAQRRKTLINNWTSIGVAKDRSEKILSDRGMSRSKRPEELTLDEWLALRRDLSI